MCPSLRLLQTTNNKDVVRSYLGEFHETWNYMAIYTRFIKSHVKVLM